VRRIRKLRKNRKVRRARISKKKRNVIISKKFRKALKDRKLPKPKMTCDLYADPHVKDFKGKYFEAQKTGDYVMYNTETMTVSYRGKKFGRWVGVVNYLVKVGDDFVRNVGFKGVAVNGSPVNIANGQTHQLRAGTIVVKGNKFTITSQRGEIAEFIAHGYFFNAYVRSNVQGSTGLCVHQFVHSKAFRHPQEGESVHKKIGSCHSKKRHENFCHKRGLVGANFNNCVFDLCQKMPRKQEIALLKEKRKENKKKK